MSANADHFPAVFPPLAFASRTSARTAQPVLSLEEIQRGIVEAAARPLAEAITLPAQAYTSEAFFDWEVQHLLRAGWQCVAHVSQLPSAGDFLNLELLGEPLIIVRGKDQAVRALSRVCPHRAMDIMPAGFGYDGRRPAEASSAAGCGHTRLFLCPYHAWTFELDGGLKACPEMHEARGFARDEIGLKSFPVRLWQGFVFINLDGSEPDFENGLLTAAADISAYQLAEMQLVISREWDCPFNWKALVENFMESYHHLGIHHKTLQPTMPARDTWTEEERRHYVRAHLPYKESAVAAQRALAASGQPGAELPLIPGLSAQQHSEWGLFLIHPSCLIATAPDRVIWYRLQPLGPDRLKLLTTVLVPRAVAESPGFETQREKAAAQLNEFHLEDMEVCTAVQRGLYSSGWQPGRLSHLEMPVWLFHRYLAARIRGVWPTDDHEAAPSQRPRKG